MRRIFSIGFCAECWFRFVGGRVSRWVPAALTTLYSSNRARKRAVMILLSRLANCTRQIISRLPERTTAQTADLPTETGRAFRSPTEVSERTTFFVFLSSFVVAFRIPLERIRIDLWIGMYEMEGECLQFAHKSMSIRCSQIGRREEIAANPAGKALERTEEEGGLTRMAPAGIRSSPMNMSSPTFFLNPVPLALSRIESLKQLSKNGNSLSHASSGSNDTFCERVSKAGSSKCSAASYFATTAVISARALAMSIGDCAR